MIFSELYKHKATGDYTHQVPIMQISEYTPVPEYSLLINNHLERGLLSGEQQKIIRTMTHVSDIDDGYRIVGNGGDILNITRSSIS